MVFNTADEVQPQTQLADTVAIRDFMEAFDQTVRTVPTTNVTAEERLLRGRIVIEEAFELLEALGLKVALRKGDEVHRVAPKGVIVEVDESVEIDLVETADACADLIVVTKGTALCFGIPVDDILLDEVGPSNMAKLGPDGKPILRVGDGKVVKPEGWEAPNIMRSLLKAGYQG